MKKETKKIISFLVIGSVLSAVAYAFIFNYAKTKMDLFLGIFILMWCPALAGFITQFIYERSLRGFGWGLGNLCWYLLSYFLPAVSGVLAYGFIWITGLGRINPSYEFNFFHFAIFGIIMHIAFAAGEEIGWRGFLVPNLFRTMSFTKTCFLSGIIWSAWHFPLVISGKYLSNIPVAVSLAQLTIILFAMTFTINWIRLKSGSVWPAVLLHASHNLYMQNLFDPITTLTSPLAHYFSGENGFALIAVYGLVGFIFWKKKSNLNR
ncbi:MAG: CPBP family intramembrane metalloprotease [Candidatus Omnitrophica bacterium]|nr:CPBP family intramembrane metalloprotease [Candidatus Omnitrophota bacterium]MBU1922728.1 CPBP family intramembrane metalloprotease [Candidatus Omnitrophota bacterium]